MIRAWACGRMFLSVMIRVSSYDYVHEKRAAVCIPQPLKQGFPMFSVSSCRPFSFRCRSQGCLHLSTRRKFYR